MIHEADVIAIRRAYATAGKDAALVVAARHLAPLKYPWQLISKQEDAVSPTYRVRKETVWAVREAVDSDRHEEAREMLKVEMRELNDQEIEDLLRMIIIPPPTHKS